MNPVIVISVQHTGTVFTRNLLLEHGVDIRSYHATDRHISKIKKNEKIVIPIRHPSRVADSWAKRRTNYNGVWQQVWRNIARLRDRGAHYFNIETENEREELRLLSDFVGVELTSNWLPANHVDAPVRLEFRPVKEDIDLAMEMYNIIMDHISDRVCQYELALGPSGSGTKSSSLG